MPQVPRIMWGSQQQRHIKMQSYLFRAFATVLACAFSPAFAADLNESIENDYAYLESLYQHLHQNPELSFREEETSKRIAQELTDLGFTVTQNVGGYGVVGVLENGDGPTVLVRTDLDALPVQEETGLPYASKATAKELTGQKVSVMHACGHDVHMTVFVGTARRLVERKSDWKGTLVMIGQPAEERGAGARAMLADGLFTRFPRPDYNLALHVNPALASGQVSYVPGYAYANVDSVDIKVQGIGGHGAYPHTTKDPIVIASQIVLALQTIVSREISPTDPAVVTVGAFQAGAKHNVISNLAHLQLTVRSYSDETREKIISAIKRISENTARAAGLPKDKLPTVELKKEYTPALWNDPKLTNRVANLLEGTLGAENVKESKPVMGGEDFGRYGREEPKIPSLMLSLGAVEPGRIADAARGRISLPSLHSSKFAPDTERTVKTGVLAMTTTVMDLFNN